MSTVELPKHRDALHRDRWGIASLAQSNWRPNRDEVGVPDEIDLLICHPNTPVACSGCWNAGRTVEGVPAREVLGSPQLAKLGDSLTVDLTLHSEGTARSGGALLARRDVKHPQNRVVLGHDQHLPTKIDFNIAT